MKRILFLVYISSMMVIGYGQQTISKGFEFPDDLNSASYDQYTARDYCYFGIGTDISASDFASGNFLAEIDNTTIPPLAYEATPVDGSSRSLNTSYEVGSLPGVVNVSSNGAATYAIPVDLPPGVNGMVPGVGISYNSHSGNGLLGWGWNLNATSAIRRGTTSFMQEGYIEGNDFGSYDRFYLDGNRLILVSGTYGASGSTYRLENEDFSRIHLLGSGSSMYFKVWTRGGSILEYGLTSDSRYTVSSGTVSWYMKNVKDYDNNTITYHYIDDTDGFRINTIIYAGNTVQFKYGERDDKNVVYIHGEAQSQNTLLEKIEVLGQGSLLWSYEFKYTKNLYSRLNEVVQVASDGLRYNSTVVNWNESKELITRKHIINSSFNMKQLFGDFNGDGYQDYIEYNKHSIDEIRTLMGNGTGSFTHGPALDLSTISYEIGGIECGDFDNDFKDEILVLENYIGTGPEEEDFCILRQYSVESGSIIQDPSFGDYFRDNEIIYTIGDFNGDGFEDIAINDKLNGIQLIGAGLTLNSSIPYSKNAKLYSKDFTGDGKDELFILDDKLYIYSFNTSDAKLELSYQDPVFNYLYKLKFADINGDGKYDFYDSFGKKLYLSTGKALAQVTGYNQGNQIKLGDLNGDGKEDILAVTVNTTVVDITPGGGYIVQPNVKAYASFFSDGGFMVKDYSDYFDYVSELQHENYVPTNFIIEMEDVNNDGVSDILAIFDKEIKTSIIQSDESAFDLKVASITNGLNIRSEIVYDYLNNYTNYSQTTLSHAKLVRTPLSYNAVSSVKTYNGPNLVDDVRYSYKNATFHKDYGFYGFQEQTVENITQGTKNISTLDFTGEFFFPYINTGNSYVGGNLVNSGTSSVTFKKNTLAGGFTYNIQTDAATQTNHLTGVTNTTTFASYDSYQNPTRIVVSKGNDQTITTVNTYDYVDNSTYWIPGRITNVSLTTDHSDDIARTVQTQYTYSNHRLSTETSFYGTPMPVTTTYSYTGALLTGKSVTGSGITRSESYGWDASGRFVEGVTNQLGHTLTSTFNQSTGQVVSVRDANGRTTTTQYNSLGAPVSATTPDGITQQSIVAWDQTKPSSLYKTIARTTGVPDNTVYYNAMGQPILATSVNNQGQQLSVTTEYNAKHQVYRTSLPYTSSPLAYTTYNYDTYNRVSSQTLANGTGSIQYTYNGLTNRVTTPEGFRETTVDDAGFVKSVTSESGTVNYNYFSTGNIHTQTSGGHEITYCYDERWQQKWVDDPDAGQYFTTYNALGDLLHSIDPRNNRYDFTYDELGRVKTRTLMSGGDVTEWKYDPSGNVGALNEVHHNDQIAEKYYYDGLGRINQSKQYTYGPQNKTFTFGYQYDNLGRLSQISYPGTYKVDYSYNAYGYLNTVSDNTGGFSWSNPSYNDLGQLMGYNLGNGHSTTYTYDAHFRLNEVEITNGSTYASDWDYDFNTQGNLTRRRDVNNNQDESFTFDNMNRLTHSTMGPNMVYAANTNISSKSDIGTFQYNYPFSEHKLTGIDATTTNYRVPDHQVGFNAFNKVNDIRTVVDSDSLHADFTYAYNRSRSVMQVYANNTLDYTKYYAGKLYEEKVKDGSTTKYHYVYVQGRMMGLHIDNQSTSDESYYIHTDYLGSVTSLTDPSGNVVEEYAYDAWGRRRNPDNWQQPDTRTSRITDRGYTGHEHLDAFELINMNGRVYDPAVAMFISPDPVLQDAGNTLNYNRYSYVLNNPLKYTDPSGYKKENPMPRPMPCPFETGGAGGANNGILRAFQYIFGRRAALEAGAFNRSVTYGSSSRYNSVANIVSNLYVLEYGGTWKSNGMLRINSSHNEAIGNFFAEHGEEYIANMEKNVDYTGHASMKVLTNGDTEVLISNTSNFFRSVLGANAMYKFGVLNYATNTWKYWTNTSLSIMAQSGGDGFNWPIAVGAAGTTISAGVETVDNYVQRSFKSARNPVAFNKLKPSQQAWRRTAVLGKNGAKALKYAKVTGVVGTAVGVGMAANDIYKGEGTFIDYADVGIGTASIGAAIFLASNPVGWAISAGAAVYFAGRLAYDIYQEVND